MSLRAPLHRQYKTARTETRWHLLLKTGQMPIQTSASRGYVLFSGANKGHSQKSLNCLRLADTPPECSKLGKTQIITAGKSGGVRNSVFCDQNPPACFRWNVRVMPFNEQQRSDDLLSPAACLSLSQLFVLYEHLFNDALAVGTDFLLCLFIQLVRIDRLAVL